MTTNFHYKQDDEKNKKDRLIDQRNLFGTLYSLQLWCLEDNSYIFRCKPLNGIDHVDLLGQARMKQNIQIYFATDTTVLVNSPNDDLRVFDKNGYILDTLNCEYTYSK